MDRWIGKIVVVTGASVGLGADLVRKLVENGLQVVGLARRVEKIEEIAKELESSNKSGKLYARKCDITKEDQIVETWAWIKNNIGPVNIVINNAGFIYRETITDGSYKTWQQIVNTRLLGSVSCSRETLRHLRETKDSGHIIFINGRNHDHLPQMTDISFVPSIYPCVKSALFTFQEMLTQEIILWGLQDTVRVTTISPGLISDTEVFEVAGYKEITPKLIETLPHLKREDVSYAVLYAISVPQYVQIQEITIKAMGDYL